MVCFSRAWERWKPTQRGVAFKQGDLIIENDFNRNTVKICSVPCDWFEIASWGVVAQIGSSLYCVQRKNGCFQKTQILGKGHGNWGDWDVSPCQRTVVVKHGNEFSFFSANGKDYKVSRIGNFDFPGPFFGHKKGFVYRDKKGRIVYAKRNGEKEILEEEVPADWKAGFDRIFYRKGDEFFSVKNNNGFESGRFVCQFRANDWYPHPLGVMARQGDDKFFLLASS